MLDGARHARFLACAYVAQVGSRDDAALLHDHLALGRARGIDPVLGVGAVVATPCSSCGSTASGQGNLVAYVGDDAARDRALLRYSARRSGRTRSASCSPCRPTAPGRTRCCRITSSWRCTRRSSTSATSVCRCPSPSRWARCFRARLSRTIGSRSRARGRWRRGDSSSAAIIAGMWWSYEVLGWGGYWAWDPVENASFLPWLTATAFLHSAMVQERRGMLRVWNLNLVVGTFVLTILGTFLTRSGIISSVHAFTTGTIGYYFLAFIGLVLHRVAGPRGGQLRARASQQGASRFRGIARNRSSCSTTCFLTGFMLTVLLGHAVPARRGSGARREGERGRAVLQSDVAADLIAALLFLMGVGPALPWKIATRARARAPSLCLRPPVPRCWQLIALVVAGRARCRTASLAFAFVGYSRRRRICANIGSARARGCTAQG